MTIYILGTEADFASMNALQKFLFNKGIDVKAECLNPDNISEYENADIAILWMSGNPDQHLLSLAKSRKAGEKTTFNVFAKPFELSAEARNSICRNCSVYSALYGEGKGPVFEEIYTLLGEVKIIQNNTENTPDIPVKPQKTKPEVPAVQPEPQAPKIAKTIQSENSSKKSSAYVWVSLIIGVAILGYFLDWWHMPFSSEEYETEEIEPEEIIEVYENLPTESELINLIQLANKYQRVAFTSEFADLIEQKNSAPNVVWEGGISQPDASPELLVPLDELGAVLYVNIIDQKYNNNKDKAEIVFEYYSQINDYTSEKHIAIAYIANDNNAWQIYDIGMYASNHNTSYTPEYLLSNENKTYIRESNQRIQSGETLRDLYNFFGDSPEELHDMLEAVDSYCEKYNVAIPDSLSYHCFVLEKAAE